MMEKQSLDEPVKELDFVFLTTTPNETVSAVHNQLPLIVKLEHYNW